MRDIHDHYFREAKRLGYRSRAAFKLIEIDDRRRILRKGDRVLDCGCAPGSWLQVAGKRVGPRGVVVGIDLQPVPASGLPDNVRTITGDLCETDDPTLLAEAGIEGGDRFDVILSDMAPSTTGVRDIDHHGSVRLCRTLLDRAARLLRPGGALVMKVFEGEAYPDLLARTRTCFAQVKGFSPKASRSDSVEMFVVATGFKPAAEVESDRPPPPRKKPSTGWGT